MKEKNAEMFQKIQTWLKLNILIKNGCAFACML